jgi:putative ABC transport system permease protein
MSLARPWRVVKHDLSVFVVGAAGLGVALGAWATCDSVLRLLTSRQLAVPAARSLVAITWQDNTGRPVSAPAALAPTLQTALDQQIAWARAYNSGGMMLLTSGRDRRTVLVDVVAGDLLSMLGVTPLLGTVSMVESARSDNTVPEGVLGFRFWRERFGGDPAIVGQRIDLDARSLRIVGVLPETYRGLAVETSVDVTVALGFQGIRSSTAIIASMKPGVTLTSLAQGLPSASSRAVTAAPGLTPRELARLTGAKPLAVNAAAGFSILREKYSPALTALWRLSAAMVLVGVVNLAGLFVLRTTKRTSEFLTRRALGCPASYAARSVLIETTMTGLCAGAIAVPIAFAGTAALARYAWVSSLPMAIALTPSAVQAGAVLAIGLVAGAIAGVMCLLTSGFRAERLVTSSGRLPGSVSLASRALLTLQVMFVAVLGTGALSASGAAYRLTSAPLGFDPNGLTLLRALPIPPTYTDFDEASYFPAVLRSLSEIPGVSGAAMSHTFSLPLVSSVRVSADRANDGRAQITAASDVISPGFLSLASVPVAAGRDFTWHDDRFHPDVAIVTASLAKTLFGGGSVLGQHVVTGEGAQQVQSEVVGIVPDMQFGSPKAPVHLGLLRPSLQVPASARSPIYLVASQAPLADIDRQVAAVVASYGKEYTMPAISAREQLRRSLAQEYLLAFASGGFAVIALISAAIGLYTLVAYEVQRYAKATAIRIAMGASPQSVLRDVAARAAPPLAAGLMLGAALATVLGRSNFGVTGQSTAALWQSMLLILLISAAAVAIPARRASKTDPLGVLRTN